MSKPCSVCKTEKPLTDFYKSAKEKTGYGNRCKACDKLYRQTRKVQVAAYMRVYVQTPEYKQRRAAQCRARTVERMQHKIEAAKNSDNLVLRRWQLNAAKRFTSRLQATPQWLSFEQRERTKAIYAITQQLQELTASVYHVDHIVPLRNDNVCGLHVWWNLQPLPEAENLAKQNLFDPTIFPEQGKLAFPDGSGPISVRLTVQIEKVEQSDE